LAYKFVSPSNRGVPDRLYIKSGKVIFIEFKAPGKKPTALQTKILKQINDQSVPAYVIDDIATGEELFNGIQTT